MENQTKICSKCTIKQENAGSDNNLAVCVCGNSVDSLQFFSTGGNCNNLASGVYSRSINEKNICNETKNESNFLEMSSTHVQLKNNCSIFLLEELKNDSILTLHKMANGNISRVTKSSDSNGINLGKRSLVIKKREDIRRVTHNEVERRRRDKMNSWIFKLKELIPESTQANYPQTESKAKGNGTESKSQILIRACEYIGAMQNELKRLRTSLMENGNLSLNNPELLLETTSHDPTHEVEIKCLTINGRNGSC